MSRRVNRKVGFLGYVETVLGRLDVVDIRLERGAFCVLAMGEAKVRWSGGWLGTTLFDPEGRRVTSDAIEFAHNKEVNPGDLVRFDLQYYVDGWGLDE